jgi:hypothetical protein
MTVELGGFTQPFVLFFFFFFDVILQDLRSILAATDLKSSIKNHLEIRIFNSKRLV